MSVSVARPGSRQAARLRPGVVFIGLALLIIGGYLSASLAGGYLGFPLDDSWIHQAYGRNLGQHGQFAFALGQPSAGSTSPAWSLLLAVGYALRIDYRAWTYGLGALLLGLNGWLAYGLARRLRPAAPAVAWLAGLLVVGEWHLAWASGSGMETLLASALALAAFGLAARGAWMAAGLAAGAAVAARPDGLLLLPWLLAAALLTPGLRPRDRYRAAAWVLGGFAVLFIPYLVFNWQLSGAPWPNTFYAKQAEYAVLRQQPLALRLARVSLQPFVGAQLLLAPGVAVSVWRAWRARQWAPLAIAGWVASVLAVYALRLPVTYQYGRYVVPVIPAAIVLGLGGLAQILHLQAERFALRVVSRVWAAALALLGVIFLALGAGLYARDVRIIQTEMVAVARWVSQNTEPGALVAAHDIGALGYFGGRPLLDMAGLVSPEVIPFVRDETRLAAWLDAAGADYLVTFPGWYPDLVQRRAGAPVYSTGAPYSPAAGGENMIVYWWGRGD